jgi:regulator of sigma E protease
MFVVLSVFVVFLSLLLVVGIHEAGHAFAAYLFKIKIKKISIGFGKPLFSWQGRRGCQWVWARWPLGGYVQLLNSRIEPVSLAESTYSFDKKPVWARCIVLLAGAFANMLTAWLALVFMFMLGYQQTVPVIEKITPSSIAFTAGLLEGERISSIAGQPVASWREVGMQLIMALGHDGVDVVVENVSGVTHQVQLNLAKWHYGPGKNSLLLSIGISPDASEKNIQQVMGLSWWSACQHAFLHIAGIFYFFLVMLKQLLMGVIPFSLLLGPLGLFSVMVSSFLQGLTVFLYFIASLSLSVALVNLLPVPGLDGGLIVYAIIEKIRGKPVSVGFEILLHRLVFIAFCLILVQLLLNDVRRVMI